jgi:hypothetical protein
VLACPPARGAAVLDEACSKDQDIPREVESLLNARERAGSFRSAARLRRPYCGAGFRAALNASVRLLTVTEQSSASLPRAGADLGGAHMAASCHVCDV